MNNYYELIKNINGDAAFRHIISECGADGRVWFDKKFICDYVSHLKCAIEQLARECGAEAYMRKRWHFNEWCRLRKIEVLDKSGQVVKTVGADFRPFIGEEGAGEVGG